MTLIEVRLGSIELRLPIGFQWLQCVGSLLAHMSYTQKEL